MQRNALLVGAQTGGLLGIGTDLDAVEAALDARAFRVHRVEGAAATRQGILDAYRGLIDNTGSGDAVVIHFSLHGGIAEQTGDARPDGARTAPRRFQFIVPVDFDESTDGDFRGITALELSDLQDQLAARTSNVTVILDCCYASGMSRNERLVPRALPRVTYADIADHLRRIDGATMSGRRADPAGNQSAVRLVACGPDESAFEYSPQGRDSRAGVFTEALCQALAEAGDLPISWSALMRTVRQRVQVISPLQRPEAEGPAHRLIFDTAVSASESVPVLIDGHSVQLLGGRLRDIAIGDTFAVMPAGSSADVADRRIGIVTVHAAGAALAEGPFETSVGADALPRDAAGFPIGRDNRRYPVAVLGDDAGGIRAAIAGASHVRCAGPDDRNPLATVEVAGAVVSVSDQFGLLQAMEDVDPGTVVAALNRLARAATLRRLESGSGPEFLAEPFEVEVGEILAGAPAPGSGTLAVSVGGRLYVRLTNRSRHRLYFFAFDVGISGRITLLTNTDPSGIALDRDETHVVGEDELTRLVGLALHWPPSVPDEGPRPESLLVIVTSRPVDLSGLQQEGLGTGRGGRSQLETLLDQVAAGGRRELTPGSTPVRYAVRRTDLLLYPFPLPQNASQRFLIDERPDPSRQLFARGPRRPPPEAVAVRLHRVQVHRNRAWGRADIRLDSLVITGGGPGKPPVLRAHTEHFPRVKDDDRLSLDRLLVFHGPVHDFLDIAVWVTRNRASMLRLTDLLDEQMNTPEMEQALATAAALGGAGAQAAVIAGAIGATAKIVDVAYRLLSAGVGDSIGVYRNSLLAQERFGIGTHPRSGVLRAQDFSFGYEVVDLKGAGR